MIYMSPTKRGLGLEIWGTYEDLNDLYSVISKFWNHVQYINKKGFENRDKLISGLSYEIRKAKEGMRQKRESSHFNFVPIEYLGVKFSWPHFLFSLSAIKYNMQYYKTNKFDISMILQIEYWLEEAMHEFDTIGTERLIGFIEGGLFGANEHIYQYMRSVNIEYFLLGGGKRAFRKLPELLKRGVYSSNEYSDYKAYLEKESKKLNCKITDLEIDDESIDYENIKW